MARRDQARDELIFRDQRRMQVIESSSLVGLDYVTAYWLPELGCWSLKLQFLPSGVGRNPPLPEGLEPHHLRISIDGAVDPGVWVEEVRYPPAEGGDEGASPTVITALVRRDVTPTGAGTGTEEESHEDLPVHLLEIVDVPSVDRFFDRAYFVFRDAGTDPGQGLLRSAASERPLQQDIDYLAKDYASFRQLMLESLARFVPSWSERNPADLGVTVVETLAYAADYLSYYQDAVATEAYLSTARQRISVRRHARVLDHRLHEGTNARVWVHLECDEDLQGGYALPAGIEILSFSPRTPPCLVEGSAEHRRALEQGVLVFCTLHPLTLRPELNEIEIYTWSTLDFVLPTGTARAALVGHLPHLRAGDALVFERHQGEGPGSPSEADPRHRQVVRLSRDPQLAFDPAVRRRKGAITEIEWFEEDALRFDFPVSRTVHSEPFEKLTVVRGNLVLADHGRTQVDVLDSVPGSGAFTLRLSSTGLTHSQPSDAAALRRRPAAGALDQDPRRAVPALELRELAPDDEVGPPPEEGVSPWKRWNPRRDLLGSGRFAADFNVEMDDDGHARLRFGGEHQGRRPPAGTRFEAVYRVGRGPAGNVGIHAIRHVVLPRSRAGSSSTSGAQRPPISRVENPMPGAGGLSREGVESCRLFAPQALRSPESLQRCVVESDYAAVAERHPDVLKAVAQRRWSGTANVAQLFVQRHGGRPIHSGFDAEMKGFMEPYLPMGWEIKISSPRFVPIDLRLTVSPQTGTELAHFRQKILSRLASGEVEFLHPDYFTFGKSVYLSEVVAAMMAMAEVAAVRAEVFHPWGKPAKNELRDGEIRIGPLEIAQLENNPAAPHRGLLEVGVVELDDGAGPAPKDAS